MRRRDFLALSGAATGAALAPGWARHAIAQQKPETLAGMTWGGNWAAALRKGVDQKFEKETGIRVVQDLSNPVQRITKLKVNLQDQIYDVVQLHDGLMPLAVRQGVLEKVNRDSPRLTNLRSVYPNFIHDHWVVQIFSAIGITYNEKRVKTPPESFADLWRPEYKGRIVLPEVAHSIGTYIIPIGALARGKDPKDAETGFEMLRRMKDQQPIWANNTDAILNAFRTEEAVIGLMYKSQTYTLIDANVPVKWAYPKEGAIAISWGTGIAKNTKNLEWAERYLNLTLDPEAQTHFTEYANYPGSNRDMINFLPDRLKERVRFSDQELAGLIELDHEFMSDRRSEWSDRWNRIIAGG